MGKKSRAKQRQSSPLGGREPAPAAPDGAIGEVGPRQPCPCGSGRRYKNCHGRGEAAPTPYVARTFAGLPGECDWVALREIVPAATAPLRLRPGAYQSADGDSDGEAAAGDADDDDAGDGDPGAGDAGAGDPAADGESADRATSGTRMRDITVCSLLPLATPAMVRADGSVQLGLQVHANHGDVSRDLAHTLELALAAEPGTQVSLPGPPPPGPRLQDLVDPVTPLEVTVHDGFDYWVSDLDDPDGDVAAALESANEAAAPTARLDGLVSAYWTRMGEREYVRWVRPDDEGRLLDALARLHAAGADGLGESSRLLGMFRAHGLLTPVWEVPAGTGPEGLASATGPLAERLDAALSDETPLTAPQRSARHGLASRQLTLR